MHNLLINQLKTKLDNADKLPCILFCEVEDDRVRQAAWQLQQQGLARTMFVSNKQFNYPECKQIETIVVTDDTHLEQCVEHLYNKRKHKGISIEDAEKMAQNPLIYAYLLVDIGVADGSVNGAVTSTAEVVRAALQIIGARHENHSVSSFFLMLPNDVSSSVYLFADCALTIDPDAQQLAHIASSTIDSARTILTEEPRVAMLSFSTAGSAQHAHVDKVRQATRQLKSMHPDVTIDGEMQFDAAVVPAISKQKMPESAVPGNASILIFPDLNAGNIGYKIAQHFGKFVAVGPILQGLNKPVNDLSRGCSMQDVYYTALITALQAL